MRIRLTLSTEHGEPLLAIEGGIPGSGGPTQEEVAIVRRILERLGDPRELLAELDQ